MTGLTDDLTMDPRRLLRMGALIAAAMLLSLAAFATSARAAEADPTVVLVHGAFASPAGWSRVAGRLHRDGYRTATPALGLVSAADDARILSPGIESSVERTMSWWGTPTAGS